TNSSPAVGPCQVPTLWQGISPGSLERIVATALSMTGVLMPRTAISGLVCTTFLVLLGFPAVPQEPAGEGGDTESGPLTFNNACRWRRTTRSFGHRVDRSSRAPRWPWRIAEALTGGLCPPAYRPPPTPPS